MFFSFFNLLLVQLSTLQLSPLIIRYSYVLYMTQAHPPSPNNCVIWSCYHSFKCSYVMSFFSSSFFCSTLFLSHHHHLSLSLAAFTVPLGVLLFIHFILQQNKNCEWKVGKLPINERTHTHTHSYLAKHSEANNAAENVFSRARFCHHTVTETAATNKNAEMRTKRKRKIKTHRTV